MICIVPHKLSSKHLHHIFISIIKPCEALWYLRNFQMRSEDSCDECMHVLLYLQDGRSSVWSFTLFNSAGADSKRNWKGVDKHLLELRKTTAQSYSIPSSFIINGNLRIIYRPGCFFYLPEDKFTSAPALLVGWATFWKHQTVFCHVEILLPLHDVRSHMIPSFSHHLKWKPITIW